LRIDRQDRERPKNLLQGKQQRRHLHLLRPEPGTRTELGGPEIVPGSVLRGLPVEVVDAASGQMSVPVEPWGRNSFGAMNGGVVAAFAARCGAEMASAVQGRHEVLTDLVVHYMAPASAGPLTTTGTTVRADAHGTAVRIDLLDTGQTGDDGTPRPVVLAHVSTALST
jgi:acyl-coenzyme A thioesterase PaaI-like protein